MELVNLSAEPEGRLRSWLPHDLEAEKVVFLPDACPGKSPLPTGTAVMTRRDDWRRLAVSDVGCGMRLLRSELPGEALDQGMWNEIARRIKANKGRLGDLGGGNHFFDALLPYDEDVLYFLVHTGSRHESGLVDHLVDRGAEFDAEFARVTAWAGDNRAEIQNTAETVAGPMELILDAVHNSFEKMGDGVIVRKGAVRAVSGDLAVIPSHMSGDVTLVAATDKISLALNSLSHGTGRTMSRSRAKDAARDYDFAGLRSRVLLPGFVGDGSLTTEAPLAYRDLDACLGLLDGYVVEKKRFSVVGCICSL